MIAKCLEFEPGERYSTATEVARALVSSPVNLQNLRKDNPWLVGSSAAALAITLLATLNNLWQTRHYYRPTKQALYWYNIGVAAIHEGTYVSATHSLKEAMDQDPKFAMAHVRQAEAWENLDFEADANRELLVPLSLERSRRLGVSRYRPCQIAVGPW